MQEQSNVNRLEKEIIGVLGPIWVLDWIDSDLFATNIETQETFKLWIPRWVNSTKEEKLLAILSQIKFKIKE
jgi:hypothetical protein